MIRHYRSAPANPRERGLDFGSANSAAIAATTDRYAELFAATAGEQVDVSALGQQALVAIQKFSAAAASEISGIAEGAGLPVEQIAALNARTEILATLHASHPGECSTLVWLGDEGDAPVALQTWDWHDIIADSWLVWTIEHPNGRVVHTLTEYGVLGKIGVTAGLGLNLNILHHGHDGGSVNVPVHVLARCVLDTAGSIGQALALIGATHVSASSAMTLTAAEPDGPAAITAEVFPGGPRFVAPGPDGLLLHTNHFLDPHAAEHERENKIGPDSFLRLAVLRHRLARRAGNRETDLLAAMCSHSGGGGAICCHPEPGAILGERYATLATVSLDVARGSMTVRAGGPCSDGNPWWTTPDSTPVLSMEGA
jgi:isopenicillin-N N-acyltransferase like protein